LHDVPGQAAQPGNVGRVAAENPGHRFDIADDDGQQIVEIMRDTAGQLPDAFHLLRLTRALISGASFRQIPGNLGKTH
jgi:hypothetical protein